MMKIIITEKGKKVQKVVSINIIGKSGIKMNVLDSLGLSEVPLKDLSKIQNVEKHVEDMCCICQESFEIGSQRRILQCNHFFHDSCIEKWLTGKIKCPLCSQDIA